MTTEQLAQIIRANPGCAIKLGDHDWDWRLLGTGAGEVLVRSTDMTDPRDRRLETGVLLALAEIAGVEVRN